MRADCAGQGIPPWFGPNGCAGSSDNQESSRSCGGRSAVPPIFFDDTALAGGEGDASVPVVAGALIHSDSALSRPIIQPGMTSSGRPNRGPEALLPPSSAVPPASSGGAPPNSTAVPGATHLEVPASMGRPPAGDSTGDDTLWGGADNVSPEWGWYVPMSPSTPATAEENGSLSHAVTRGAAPTISAASLLDRGLVWR